MDKISVIVPCYCEEQVLPLFYEEIAKLANSMNFVEFEFLFVNDGSTDKTLSIIKEFSENDKRVKYVSFSRNFGKESAMYAGLCNASGDYLVIIDADLQQPISLISKMYDDIINKHYDCVATRRTSRKGESRLRCFLSSCFYKLVNKISKVQLIDGAQDYRMMTRQMAESIISVGEYNRFLKGIFSWVGYDVEWIEYENAERAAGNTKWTIWKLFLYSIDGITAFSTAPLSISSAFGMLFFVVSIIGIIAIIIRQTLWGYSAYGWSSLVCIILLIAGVQLYCIGILGQYLSRTYLESKRRPIYIIKQTNIKKGQEHEKVR